jgi:hypothetical protein
MGPLATLDTLARARLAAKRAGLRSWVEAAPSDVVELAELAGLARVLGLEPRRQPEEREQRLRLEEERDLADPPA